MYPNIIQHKDTIKQALTKIDELAGQTLFIVDENDKMIGTLTDGDIRRGLLNGANLDSPVEEFMSKKFKFLIQHEFSSGLIKELKKTNIVYVPLLSSNHTIIDVINLDKLESILPLEAIIMAGGKGTRLKPLTLKTPKPLLKIGDKPIIEYNIDRLIKNGVKKIYISVNYLKEQIKEYFGDGSNKGISIEYIEEEIITGTLGSATYIDNFSTKDILVMNSDLLTDIDFEHLYETYLNHNAEMAIATVPYKVNIPYGIVETKNAKVVSLKEKPTYTYYSNAGIYIINAACIKEIPQKAFYNATDLIEKLINNNRKVVSFPILNYWLDIGKPLDFEKAQEDIKHLKL